MFQDFFDKRRIRLYKYKNYPCKRKVFSSTPDHTYLIIFQRDCKRNFKWPSMQRWQYPIHNGTLVTLIWSKMWKTPSTFFWLESVYFCEFFHCSYKQEMRIWHCIFAWRVTWNNACSPFNTDKKIFSAIIWLGIDPILQIWEKQILIVT